MTINETMSLGLGNIVFFGTPAYGHVNPTLPIVTELVSHGYAVTYYATEEFRAAIEACGAKFRAYDFGDILWSPEVGSRILELAELLVRFTDAQAEVLLYEARKLRPVLVFHDTLAFWGRVVGAQLGVRTVSVNTIVTAYRYGGKAFFQYATRFTGTSLRELKAVPGILRYKKRLKKRYGIKRTDLLGLLMNEEQFNVFTYPQAIHPEGLTMKNCFFVGPAAILREDESEPEETYRYDNLIYVSLGTIFNHSPELYRAVIEEFGGTKYTVVISCGAQSKELLREKLPDNIIVKPYVNQKRVLRRAILFLSSGGMNSICEAAAGGVPCLMYPQQGEQDINARAFVRLGLGTLLRKKDGVFGQAEEVLARIQLKEDQVREFATVRMKELMEKLENYQKTGEC